MSDLKVYVRPAFAGPDRGEGGIRRWVEMQHKYLPAQGIEVLSGQDGADVVACHAGDIVNTAKPLVAHCHGLYNTAAQNWSNWAWMLNRSVIEVLRRSAIATAPSTWVAAQLARGAGIRARVLYAGVEPEMWQPGEPQGYILWNKTRVDPICDPTPLNLLAARNPARNFVSTFGDSQLPNLRLTGKLPFGEAADLVRHASVYLCTARETFGIGTLEAMACGVPVLGWDWGGQQDIVAHGRTGYLARPGDYQDLQAGLEMCLANRGPMGEAARAAVIGRFTWEAAVAECAAIYRQAAEAAEGPRTSIIVTCHNLEEFLPDCLASIAAQTDRDWECIVVDDCSPGPCREIVDAQAARDPRFFYLRTPRNLYLAGARNFGIQASRGRYILPLDADDMLGDQAVAVLAGFLDQQPGYAIAYGAMEVLEPDGKRWTSTWPPQFSWEKQMALRPDGQANQNQLPYASMYRRTVWERAEGYRPRCQTSEDNDFWCRATSYGARAQRVTGYPTLIYRNRPDSMSHAVAWPDCTRWYPWARNRALTPFASVGTPPNELSWPVQTYAEPKVSIIIACGPGHGDLLADALDSVLAQTVDGWECIVANDSGEPLRAYPWARVIDTPAPGSGPSAARNLGLAAARAPLVAFLDADDYLMPAFLERTIPVVERFGGYAYTDWFQIDREGHEPKEAPDFEAMDLLQKGLQWGITCLFRRADLRAVGGFDPEVAGWEDWDLFFALATKGICGNHISEPLWCYRYWSGNRREAGYEAKADNARALRRKWAEYSDNGGEKLMPCRGCGGGGGQHIASGQSTPTMRELSRAEATVAQAQDSGMVLIEYTGTNQGTQTVRGPRSGTEYRFGSTEAHRRKFVYAVDAPGLLAVVPNLALVAPEPAPAAAAEPPAMRQDPGRVAAVPAPKEAASVGPP